MQPRSRPVRKTLSHPGRHLPAPEATNWCVPALQGSANPPPQRMPSSPGGHEPPHAEHRVVVQTHRIEAAYADMARSCHPGPACVDTTQSHCLGPANADQSHHLGAAEAGHPIHAHLRPCQKGPQRLHRQASAPLSHKPSRSATARPPRVPQVTAVAAVHDKCERRLQRCQGHPQRSCCMHSCHGWTKVARCSRYLSPSQRRSQRGRHHLCCSSVHSRQRQLVQTSAPAPAALVRQANPPASRRIPECSAPLTSQARSHGACHFCPRVFHASTRAVSLRKRREEGPRPCCHPRWMIRLCCTRHPVQ